MGRRSGSWMPTLASSWDSPLIKRTMRGIFAWLAQPPLGVVLAFAKFRYRGKAYLEMAVAPDDGPVLIDQAATVAVAGALVRGTVDPERIAAVAEILRERPYLLEDAATDSILALRLTLDRAAALEPQVAAAVSNHGSAPRDPTPSPTAPLMLSASEPIEAWRDVGAVYRAGLIIEGSHFILVGGQSSESGWKLSTAVRCTGMPPGPFRPTPDLIEPVVYPDMFAKDGFLYVRGNTIQRPKLENGCPGAFEPAGTWPGPHDKTPLWALIEVGGAPAERITFQGAKAGRLAVPRICAAVAHGLGAVWILGGAPDQPGERFNLQ